MARPRKPTSRKTTSVTVTLATLEKIKRKARQLGGLPIGATAEMLINQAIHQPQNKGTST